MKVKYENLTKLPLKYDDLTQHQRSIVRDIYVTQQKGKCWYCDGSLSVSPPDRILKYKIDLKWFPPGFLNTAIHLQHDHKTGLTEGAVHAYCNAVLWQYFNR